MDRISFFMAFVAGILMSMCRIIKLLSDMHECAIEYAICQSASNTPALAPGGIKYCS